MGSYEPSPSNCLFMGPNSPCERIPYFSSPTVLFLGVPTGTPTHDMKIELETSMITASNWRSDPNPPPSTPSNFTSIHDCYGLNLLTWSASTNASSYQVLKDTSSNFDNPEIIYFGAGTTANANVPSGEVWYLKVKACNSAGCSALSNQQTAIYSNNCN